MSFGRDNGYSSSQGGGYSSSQGGDGYSSSQNGYSSTYTAPVPVPANNFYSTSGQAVNYSSTQTSSNLFGNYHNQHHHNHGTQHIDEVASKPCCTIL